jgi:hypothetical protein
MMFFKQSLFTLAALLSISFATPVPSAASDLAALQAIAGKPTNAPQDTRTLDNGQGSCIAVQGINVCSDIFGNPITGCRYNYLLFSVLEKDTIKGYC